MARLARLRAFAVALPARLRAGWPADRAPVSRAPLSRHDIALALVFAALGAAATFFASGLLDRRLLETETMDVWFEADIPRVVRSATDRYSSNDNAKFHPLFVLFVLPMVVVIRAIVGLDAWVAVRVVFAAAAAIWGAGLFAFLRLIGCRRPDAVAFTLLGATSAGAMFWFPIPETHTLASPTVLAAMIVVAASAHRVIPVLLEVAVSALTLSVTITNWMAGLLAPLLRRSLRQTVLISAGAFVLVVALWSVQRVIVRRSAFFVGGTVGAGHVLSPESGGVLHVAEAFFVHAVVMPRITVADRPGAGKWPVMLVQPANPGSAGALSLVSAVLWCGLLGAGLWAMVRLHGRERLRLYLGLLLVGQFGLFLLFGNETFLFTPNFLPILIGVAALSALTPARSVVLGITSVLIVTNTAGNVAQLRRAHDFFTTFAPYRHDYAEAKAARPEGPWPSGTGGRPVDVAPPGTRIFDRGSVLSGGGFTPGLDQFVVSLWVLGESGAIMATSDAMPNDQVTPLETRAADSSVVEAGVATPYYRALWRAWGTRRYRLDLAVPPGQRVALVVRGVGPPRAPVRRLEWNGERLLVNQRWSVAPTPAVVAAYLVNENTPHWATLRPEATDIAVIDGWAAARLELLEPGAYRFEVYDTNPSGPMDRVVATLPPFPGPVESREAGATSVAGAAHAARVERMDAPTDTANASRR